MRISRRPYVTAQIVLLPLCWATFGFLALAVWTLDHGYAGRDIPQPLRAIEIPPTLALAVAIVAAIVSLALVVVLIALAVMRLHDLGMTGWFLLVWPVLILLIETSSDKTSGVTAMSEVAFEAILMMVPGMPGPNAYGPEPGQ